MKQHDISEDDIKAAIKRVSLAADAAVEAAKACQLPKTIRIAEELSKEAKPCSAGSVHVLRELNLLQKQFLHQKCEYDMTV